VKEKSFIKQPLYLVFSIFIVSAVLLLLLYGTIKLEHSIEEKMVAISTTDIFSVTDNTTEYIHEMLDPNKDFITQVADNNILQANIERSLEVLITKNIAYAYLLYKDKRGVFRFLADGSLEDKAFLHQKFDIDNPKWLEVYKTKEALSIEHLFLQDLAITYISPLVQDDEVKLLLVVDFSVKKVLKIEQILTMMKYGIIMMIAVIVLFLLVLIFQTIRYFAMRKNAYIDKLTGVYNRNYLQDAQEFINLNEYVLATIDIDHFKAVNDTYGHDAGDRVLAQVASCITSVLKVKQDIVIRYGGEEFVVLVKTHQEDTLEALNSIENIFEAIRNYKFHISSDEYLPMTVSIGVNLHPYKSRTFSQAFKLADTALYHAKNRGRNTIELYDENENRNNSMMLSINEIKEAIEEKRLLCYFQKIVSNSDQSTSHYEALLRIEDKDGSIITPDKILPAIEGTFILRNISKAVLEICYLKLQEESKISLNVNLNPADIVNQSIIAILQEYAKTPNIAQRLGLEVVETQDIIHCEDGRKNLLFLKSLGYKIYIDDFGSGYSNFIYLTQIQTDFIKIDGGIIKNILEDKISYLLVKSVVEFAKAAGIKVIAEFVSSEEIYEKVKELGIEYSQGYYFSVPSRELR